MSRRLRIGPSARTALPGDGVRDIDPGEAGAPSAEPAVAALVGAIRRAPDGTSLVEVVVDGWRFELEVEDADRADLRRRATREADPEAASGPLDIRAIIPGRVAAIRVAVDDAVEAGRSLLVVEAMKMQNELRAPRDGVVARIAIEEGATIEHGDLLIVLR